MNDLDNRLSSFRGELANGGEMGERIRSFAWDETDLGPLQTWPASLLHGLGFCLEAGSPMGIFWGPDFLVFYNDPMKTLIGDKHPRALGRPAREVFSEIWPKIGPLLAHVRATGSPTGAKDELFSLNRHGTIHDGYFTYTYSPIRGEDGKVAGVLNVAVETTERVLAERALRASEARYRAFVHATSNSLYRMSADGTQLLEVVGSILLPHEAAAGPSDRPFQNYIHPEDREMARRAFAKAVDTGSPYEVEVRGRRPDGTFGWVLSRAVPVKNETGQIIEWLGSATDITERKRGEQALLRSEARLKAAIDLIGLSPYSWDPPTGALEWDARLKAIWGLPPDSVPNHDVFLSAVHPADRPRVEAAMAAAVDPQGDGVYAIEYRVIGINDGIERWVSTYGQTTFHDGRAVGFIGAALEVTDRKRAEEQVRQSESRLANILEQLPVGVGLYDTKGRLQIGNSMLRRFVGEILPSSDPDARRYWRAYDSKGNLLEASQYPSARALKGETVAPGVDFIRTYEGGRDVWTRVTAAPFYDQAGTVIGAVSIVQDIDDEKLAQDANLVLIAELQHRTRNLLAVVRSITHQVLKTSPSREDFAVRLNDRLSALSRVQGLLSRPAGTPVSIGELLTMELAALGVDQGDPRSTLDGPEVALPHTVVQILALALHELSTNALKYGALSTPDGHLDIAWHLFAGERGERRLRLNWRESGVTPKANAAETRRGYGLELIERALPYQLRACTTFEIKDTEVYCVIDLPLTESAKGGADDVGAAE